jgi:diamine N-acetyltransferase
MSKNAEPEDFPQRHEAADRQWPPGLFGRRVREKFPEFVQALEQEVMQQQKVPLSRDAAVSLRLINADTVRLVSLLDAGPEHDHLVAPNAFSIAQAYFHPEAWFRAIYADHVPVGFVMLSDPSQVPGRSLELNDGKPCVSLWRFMIDQRYHGMGFGAKALELVIEHARTRTAAQRMLLSFVPAKNNPEPFYARFGFERTGEIDDGEVVMALDLHPVR